jgi:hypothetical protein
VGVTLKLQSDPPTTNRNHQCLFATLKSIAAATSSGVGSQPSSTPLMYGEQQQQQTTTTTTPR